MFKRIVVVLFFFLILPQFQTNLPHIPDPVETSKLSNYKKSQFKMKDERNQLAGYNGNY